MLTLNDLSLCYGSQSVLRHVSATIEAGAFYAVMGPNGSGKTSLLRCIAGLQTPTSGNVLIDGRPLSDFSARQLARQMSYVGQHITVDFEFSAFDIVMMARNPYQRRLQGESAVDREIVENAMEQTGTIHLRHKSLAQMSGGERQRVMLARAIAQQTPIMLLDEPLANLDIAHQFEILDLLRRINSEEHKTILLVIHSLSQAYAYSPMLLLLHNSAIGYQGPLRQGFTPDRIREVFGVDSTIANDTVSLKPLAGDVQFS